MKRRLLPVVILVIVVLLVWLGMGVISPADRDAGSSAVKKGGREEIAGEGNTGGSSALSGKASARGESKVKATHGPQQLKDFYLEEIEIDGLDLRAALEKLREAYERVCLETGETPLALTFSVPTGAGQPLHLKLGIRNLENAIRLLAAASGMKVTRNGAAYEFSELPDGSGPATRVVRVPPDVLSQLAALSGSGSDRDLRALLAAMGIEIDAGTKLSFDPGGTELVIDAAGARDIGMLSAVFEYLSGSPPLQHQLDTQVLEIPAGSDWMGPNLKTLDRAGLEALMLDLASRNGVDVSALPSVTARNNENATIEIIRELIYPKEGSEGEFETRNLGKTIHVQAGILGLGSRVNLDFKDAVLDPNWSSSGAAVSNRTEIASTQYALDASTRIFIQTRPDGSRTLVLLTSTTLDATGRPARVQE